MLEKLKERVLKANLDLVKYNLVLFTWGNVSEIDRENGLIAIKPSGVAYEHMTAEDIVIVDLDGKKISGKLNPSSDTPTHIEIYKAMPGVSGVAHTHSTYATAFAQAGRNVPLYGTTHADYFYGEIPVTRALTENEIKNEYEKNTGIVIAETFKNLDPAAVPAVLVKNHGPFTFGKNGENAAFHAAVLEEVCKMAHFSETINPSVSPAPKIIADKHYFRKHGAGAYYGQNNKSE